MCRCNYAEVASKRKVRRWNDTTDINTSSFMQLQCVPRSWPVTRLSRYCTLQFPGSQATFFHPVSYFFRSDVPIFAIFPSQFLNPALAKIRKALDGKGGPIATVIRSAYFLHCETATGSVTCVKALHHQGEEKPFIRVRRSLLSG